VSPGKMGGMETPTSRVQRAGIGNATTGDLKALVQDPGAPAHQKTQARAEIQRRGAERNRPGMGKKVSIANLPDGFEVRDIGAKRGDSKLLQVTGPDGLVVGQLHRDDYVSNLAPGLGGGRRVNEWVFTPTGSTRKVKAKKAADAIADWQRDQRRTPAAPKPAARPGVPEGIRIVNRGETDSYRGPLHDVLGPGDTFIGDLSSRQTANGTIWEGRVAGSRQTISGGNRNEIIAALRAAKADLDKNTPSDLSGLGEDDVDLVKAGRGQHSLETKTWARMQPTKKGWDRLNPTQKHDVQEMLADLLHNEIDGENYYTFDLEDLLAKLKRWG